MATPTDREGGRFFKKGGGANRNQTRPHFYAQGRKKCDFQAQNRGKSRGKRVKILERLDEVKELAEKVKELAEEVKECVE